MIGFKNSSFSPIAYCCLIAQVRSEHFSPNPIVIAETSFRQLLATGKPVALEDATHGITTPEGFDRRAFGIIPRVMLRNGEIVEAGYRRGTSSLCNSGIKRLWIYLDKKALAGYDVFKHRFKLSDKAVSNLLGKFSRKKK